MPTDPLLGALVAGTRDPLAAVWQQLADLRGRIAALEATPTIQVVAGTPTQAARDGTPALDSSQPRLWLRRNGSWQYTTLT